MKDVWGIIVITILVLCVLGVLFLDNEHQVRIKILDEENKTIQKEILVNENLIKEKQDSLSVLRVHLDRLNAAVEELSNKDTDIRHKYEKIYISGDTVNLGKLDSLSAAIINEGPDL